MAAGVPFLVAISILCDPSIEATNWRAEQAIRPAVVTRKVCGGNRTRRGADTQQVLASVVRTARQRNLDPRSLITTMLCAPEPVVPEALALPPPACVGDPQELIISGHSSTDLFDDDAVAGRRHLMGRCADVGVCAAAG